MPLFGVLSSARWTHGALYGLAAGVVYFGIILHWITLFGTLPWILLALVEGLFVALFAALAALMMPRKTGWWGYLAVPAAWTAVPWLKSLGPYGFPWGSFAHIQANNLAVCQIASLTGPWGIDFLVCLFNLAVACAIVERKCSRTRIALLAAVVIVGLVIGGGLVSLRSTPEDGTPVRVAILQGNLKHDVTPEEGYPEKALSVYSEMSREAVARRAELIVWPEAALPVVVTPSGWGASISHLARNTGTQYLVGGYDAAEDPEITGSYNAAMLYNSQGQLTGVYRKVQLVPFGEFVPMRDRLPLLKRYSIRDEDVVRGESHVLLDSSIGKIGTAICFESLFPDILRSQTANGAEVLCITTNDSWFERTQAARHHLMMAQLRAIENRRYVIRAALTGISAFIDPHGRIVDQAGIFERKTMIGGVCGLRELTFYTRFGQYFAYLCVLITVAALLVCGRKKK